MYMTLPYRSFGQVGGVPTGDTLFAVQRSIDGTMYMITPTYYSDAQGVAIKPIVSTKHRVATDLVSLLTNIKFKYNRYSIYLVGDPIRRARAMTILTR